MGNETSLTTQGVGHKYNQYSLPYLDSLKKIEATLVSQQTPQRQMAQNSNQQKEPFTTYDSNKHYMDQQSLYG